MPFGYHLMLDLYGCDERKMTDFGVCYDFLQRIPAVIGTHKQSEPYLVKTDGERYPDKAGFSGWVPLVDSGVSIHTLDPMRFISIDVYTCKELTPEVMESVKRYTRDAFDPEEWEEKFVLRGEKYGLTPEVIERRNQADRKENKGLPS